MGDEQFNQVLANIKKQNNLDDEAKFQAALKQEGLSLVDLRRNLEKSMLISQVQRAEVTEKISITEEEAKAYYAERCQGVHDPVGGDPARDPRGGAGHRQGHQRGAGRRGQGDGPRPSAHG